MDWESVQRELNELHYAPQWQTSGFLTPGFVSRQYAQFQTDTDRNTEHYRWQAFCRILNTNDTLSDKEIDQFIALCDIDEDRTMACSAIISLLKWKGLRDSQVDDIISITQEKYNITRQVKREQLLRKLQSSDINDDIITQSIASNDSMVQRELLTKNLAKKHLEEIKQHGATRAVRNSASIMIKEKTIIK